MEYAKKYAPLVDEMFEAQALSRLVINNDEIDFDGVKTVHVYTVETVPMKDYEMSGMQRFGVPSELDNSTQPLTLTQDRAFTYTIDKRNNVDTNYVMEAGKSLARQLNQVTIPEIEKYRMEVLANNAANHSDAAITSENAYDAFLDGQIALNKANAPKNTRIAYIDAKYYKAIRLDPNFIKSGDLSQDMLLKGQIGEIDGVPVVDTNDLPEGVHFVIAQRNSLVAVEKLATYRILTETAGIDGALVEGRVYHDAWVLKNRRAGIYTHGTVTPEVEPEGDTKN